MNYRRLEIPEVVQFEPRYFGDDRGGFFESFNANGFQIATGLNRTFFQDNHSVSSRGVLRGLHYQLNEAAQGKLVRVVSGSVFDVAVDIRKSSPTFGRWVAAELSAENRHQLWIPEGFAHGFMALTDNVHFLYKTTAPYSAANERCIIWSDQKIGIEWPQIGEPTLSAKDMIGKSLNEADLFD